MKTPFWFYKKNFFAILLLPLSFFYFLTFKIIFILRLFCRKKSKIPVICVGGLLAGGVGKTPIVREIAKYFKSPVIMRGYLGKNTKLGSIVKLSDTSLDVGDEAKMLSESGIKVYVGDRLDNIKSLNSKDDKPKPIIMDDGFQNPLIKKDISILVFDEAVGIGNGFLLPAGPMRETLHSGIRRCDAILINQSDSFIKLSRIVKMAKNYKKAVFFAKRNLDIEGFSGKFIAFAGIGYPRKFFNELAIVPNIEIIKTISFPDHYFYTKNDIIKLLELAKKYNVKLLCTEKDWVKLPHEIQVKVKYIPLKISIEPKFYTWLEKKISRGLE